jgi:hypothetical protein
MLSDSILAGCSEGFGCHRNVALSIESCVGFSALLNEGMIIGFLQLSKLIKKLIADSCPKGLASRHS